MQDSVFRRFMQSDVYELCTDEHHAQNTLHQNGALCQWCFQQAKKNRLRDCSGRRLIKPSETAVCSRLQAVVHVELNRVSRHVQALAVLTLQFDVGIDQVVTEYAAFFQEVTVGIQAVQRFVQ